MAAAGAGIYMRGARPPCPPQRLAYDVASHTLIDIAGSSCVSPRTEHRLKLSHTHILGMMKRRGLAARAHRVHPLLLLLAAVLLFAATADGIRPGPDDADAKPAVQRARPGQAPGAPAAEEKDGSGFLQEEVYGTGSSLPDCTHACGACKPCNRVMVSFKCSIAEPCPMVYRCMCKGKCYPVPSS